MNRYNSQTSRPNPMASNQNYNFGLYRNGPNVPMQQQEHHPQYPMMQQTSPYRQQPPTPQLMQRPPQFMQPLPAKTIDTVSGMHPQPMQQYASMYPNIPYPPAQGQPQFYGPGGVPPQLAPPNAKHMMREVPEEDPQTEQYLAKLNAQQQQLYQQQLLKQLYDKQPSMFYGGGSHMQQNNPALISTGDMFQYQQPHIFTTEQYGNFMTHQRKQSPLQEPQNLGHGVNPNGVTIYNVTADQTQRFRQY